MKKEEMIKRLKFYFKNNKRVHIICVFGQWYNGLIKEIHTIKKTIILIEDKVGELNLSFNDIENVEIYKEKEIGK